VFLQALQEIFEIALEFILPPNAGIKATFLQKFILRYGPTSLWTGSNQQL
jgi:hypothetical protein